MRNTRIMCAVMLDTKVRSAQGALAPGLAVGGRGFGRSAAALRLASGAAGTRWPRVPRSRDRGSPRAQWREPTGATERQALFLWREPVQEEGSAASLQAGRQ